ncbi:FecR domain-containing protein [Desulfonema limicola]|uniref:FecR domain-containing protein n=1 Tax=Desulfonema limicola TaxID=45656 RepID=A0A975B5I9_9BACT|nr:FecR domain-containing protein [Desulfonema limicola]QTA79174.1 FecR domain-containing protein [Desulfonema limicola]
MQKKIQVCLIILILLFSAAASYAVETKGIGKVTDYTGDVLVRTNGKWTKLDKVPYTLYSSDKVVTNRGRVLIKYHDGDIIKLDIDSNISMNQDEKIDKKDKFVFRQINLLLGRLQFNIMPNKEERLFQFRTPTVTAGIRGTEGELEVKNDGSTKGGLISGDWETQGEMEPKKPENIDMEGSLPPSNPENAGTEIQKNANNAFQRRMAAIRALEDAKTRLANTKKGDAKGAALAAAAVVEAASTLVNANIFSVQETMTEAKRLGDSSAIQKTEEILNKMLIIADNAEKLIQMASRMTDAALDNAAPEAIQAAVNASIACAAAAEASAAASTVGINVAEIAACDMDPKRMPSAENELNKAVSRADKAAQAAQDAVDNPDNSEYLAALAQKHRDAAVAGARLSQVLSMKSDDDESNEQVDLQQKEEEADNFGKQSKTSEGDPIKSLEDEWKSPIRDDSPASPI